MPQPMQAIMEQKKIMILLSLSKVQNNNIMSATHAIETFIHEESYL